MLKQVNSLIIIVDTYYTCAKHASSLEKPAKIQARNVLHMLAIWKIMLGAYWKCVKHDIDK